MTSNQATVVIVEDDDDVRRSMQRMIAGVGYNVEAYASPKDFLAAFDPASPGCLVFDLRLPKMSGMQLFKRLQSSHRYIAPVIFVTGEGEIEVGVEAMQCGAWDFLEKPFSRNRLLDNIDKAIHFDAKTRDTLAEKTAIEQRIESLTHRENEILKLVMAGKATKEIAKQLNVSTKTVEGHRTNLYEKMGVTTLPQLALLMARSREIEVFLGLIRSRVAATSILTAVGSLPEVDSSP